MSPQREAVLRALNRADEWLAHKWFRIDSWIRGEHWPHQWALYAEKVIPLEIMDAARAGATAIYVPAHWVPYDPAIPNSVQMIMDGGERMVP